jgi:hypothetical protein
MSFVTGLAAMTKHHTTALAFMRRHAKIADLGDFWMLYHGFSLARTDRGRSLKDGSGGLALSRGDTMTEFQRLQHLVRLLADMTEEQRRALNDFLDTIGWPPAENAENPEATISGSTKTPKG